MQVHRNPFDRSNLGRNAYANLYQFQGQLAYLRKLQQVRAVCQNPMRIQWGAHRR